VGWIDRHCAFPGCALMLEDYIPCWRHTLAKFIPAHRAAWARTRLGSVALVARARFQQITSCRPGSILPFFVDGRMDQIHTNIHTNSHIQIYIQKSPCFFGSFASTKRRRKRLQTLQTPFANEKGYPSFGAANVRCNLVDVPLGLGRQSVREAKIVSPTGR